MPRHVSSSAIAVVLLLLPSCFVGCTDECATTPPCETARIYGQITGGGEPLHATVVAQTPRDPSAPSYSPQRFSAETDSAGSYSIDVIPGRFILDVRVEDLGGGMGGRVRGGSLSSEGADTFLVERAGDAVRVDMPLGSVRIEARVPPEMNGKYVWGKLQSDSGAYGVYTSATASNGRAELRFLAVNPGRHKMRFNGPTSGIWLPGTYRMEEADWITVEAGKQEVYEFDIPARGMVFGTVTGSWQDLDLSRPVVMLFDADSTAISSNTLTWDGDYQLWVLASQRVRFAIRTGDGLRWHGGRTFDDAMEIDLNPGMEVEIHIVESGIAGEIGRGTWGVRTEVELYDTAGDRIRKSYAFGATGLFRFAGLAPGDYFVRIPEGSSWIEHWYDHADSFDEATPVTIREEGEIVWIDPTLMEGARISGRILDRNGDPLVGASVGVVREVDHHPREERMVMTRHSGAFEIGALPDGPHFLFAWTSGRDDVWYPGVANRDSAEAIVISGHESVEGIILRFR